MTFLSYLNPVKIMVFLAFVYMIISYDKSRKIHVVLLSILGVSLLNEIAAPIILSCKGSIKATTTLYVFINAILWLYLLRIVSVRKKLLSGAMVFMALFAIYNFFWLDGMTRFNFYTFVVGGLLYVTLFVVDSFIELGKENLAYFSRNEYVIIAAPLLFFIGFSMLLGFENKTLHDTKVQGIKLYDLVSYFINLVYYSMVFFYIYLENRKKNVR